MDPVSHAVIGRAIAVAVAPRAQAGRGVAAAAILGALSLDIDLVLAPFGWDIYLRAHVIGTHTAVGALITGVACALLARAIVRGSSFRSLAGMAVLGAFSHLLADIASGGRLRLFWPMSNAIVSAPLVAMGDPYTIGILLGGAVVIRRSTTARRSAQAVLLVLVLFLAVKGALLQRVLSGAAATSRIDRASRILQAQWGSLTAWIVFDRTENELRQWRVTAGDDEPLLEMSLAETPESALVRRSRQLPAVRNFLAVHELGFAHEEVEPGGDAVMWSDIRYCWRDAVTQPVRCALWFGGLFDPAGRAVTQEVRVGAWIQRRLP